MVSAPIPWVLTSGDTGGPRDSGWIRAFALLPLVIGALLGAAGFAFVLIGDFGTDHPLLILSLIPIVLAAYRFGIVPGLVAMAVCYVLVAFFVYGPVDRPLTDSDENVIRVVAAGTVGIIMLTGAAYLGESRARLRAAAASQAALIVEGERVHEALAQSELQYRELSEAMPALVALVDGRGVAYYWNRPFLEYTGLVVEDTPNWLTLGLVPVEDLRAIAAEWAAHTTRGEPVSAEVRIRRHDGEYRWHMARAVPVGDRAAGAARWLLVATDIDDATRSRQALEASERRMALVASATGVGIWDVDLASGQAVWSASEFELLGIPSADDGKAEVSAWLERIVEEDEARVVDEIRRAREEVATFTSEHRIRRADTGEVRWLSETGRFLAGPSGEAARIVGVSMDVTERHRHELRQRCLAEARAVLAATVDFREALDALGGTLVPEYAEWVSVFTVDDPGAPESRVERLVCKYAAGIPELARLASVPPTIDWHADSGLPALLRTGKPELFTTATPESFAAAGDAAQRSLSQSVIHSRMLVPIRMEGRISGAISVASLQPGRYTQTDLAFMEDYAAQAAQVLEKTRLFARLQEANAAKDEFLGLVSHELRTPITTILGNATILTARPELVSAEDHATAMRDIREEAARLNGIIENLLALARLDRGIEVETEPTVVRRLLARTIASLEAEHAAREYLVSFPEAPIFVEANPVYLERVLWNLLTNAHRYSPPGTPVEIQAERLGDWLHVEVRDRGIGIDPDEAEQIFAPFYRSERTAAVKGIGVGLSLCRRLVEFQGGRIYASPRDGGGSVFTILLPTCEPVE